VKQLDEEYSGDVKQLVRNIAGCETAGGKYSGDVKQLEGNIAGM